MTDRRKSETQQVNKGNHVGKRLEERFAIVEQRIRALLTENGALAARIEELERELTRAKNAAVNFEDYKGKAAKIRSKVETVLRSLESVGSKKQD